MKTLKRIGTIVISVILWAIILLAALYAFTTMATKDDQSVSRILGYTPMTVESDSMKPTFCKGDLIFIKKSSVLISRNGGIRCSCFGHSEKTTVQTETSVSVCSKPAQKAATLFTCAAGYR